VKGYREEAVIVTRGAGSLLRWIGLAAVVGVGASAYLAWQSITVQWAAPNDAFQRFTEIRSRVHGEPVVQVGASSTLTRRPPPMNPPSRVSVLRVLAYRVPEQRLVRANVPFWFLKLKGPAVRYALRDTGLDLDRLEVTPADLEQYGPAIVFDETRQNGDRVLVWTE